MALSEKVRKVWDFLKKHDGENLTAADIAEGLDISKKVVDGCVTMGLQRKGYSVREVCKVKMADGEEKEVKFIKLTDEGRNLNPDSEEA